MYFKIKQFVKSFEGNILTKSVHTFLFFLKLSEIARIER